MELFFYVSFYENLVIFINNRSDGVINCLDQALYKYMTGL